MTITPYAVRYRSSRHAAECTFPPAVLSSSGLLIFVQVMDEFVRAVMGRWPNAVLQFEDFNLGHAYPLLERYREHHLVFNDDIQV